MANYQIDSNFSNVHVLASNLREYCLEKNIDEATAGVLELMLVEAVNNVIEHAHKEKPGFIINAQFEIEDDVITITIIDDGKPFNEAIDKKQLNAKNEESIEELPEGGWGLGLIESIADNIEKYNVNGTNILVLTKNIKVDNNQLSHA